MKNLIEGDSKSKKYTAEDMEEVLSDRYCDSLQWVFLTQVRSSTGSANRIADAMAFNMYGSTGYEILGFEIKVSRSDFLSELKDMSKSDEIMGYCDKWYLVVPDSKIVQDGELPKNWGLLVLNDGKLVQKVRAIPKKPETMPLSFIASILRRSGVEVDRIRNQYVKKEDIAKELDNARNDGYKQARGYSGIQTEERLKSLQELVSEFEKAAGITLDSYKGKEYAKSVGMYVNVALKLDEIRVGYNTRCIESAIGSLQKALVDMNKIGNSLGKDS